MSTPSPIPTPLVLSKWEQTFLLDRLELRVIPDVLCDTWDDISPEEAERAEKLVTTLVAAGSINLHTLSRVEAETFRDAIEGSTWFAALNSSLQNGEVSPHRMYSDRGRLLGLLARIAERQFNVKCPPME